MSQPTQVNEGVAVVIVSRTQPIQKGPRPAAESLPAVFSSDQPPVPVREVDKSISEVELSLLGIPRAEGQLGLFGDVTTYDATPNEWQAGRSPDTGTSEVTLAGTAAASAFTHVPAESAAYIESNASLSSGGYALMGTKRFFRYQPGRVSGATLGAKMSISADFSDVKKLGVYDRFNGYYWEIQGGESTQAQDFNLLCVKRSNAFSSALSGITPVAPDTGTAGVNARIVRDGHTWIHAAIHDKRLRVNSGGVLIACDSGPDVRVGSAFQYVYEYRVPRKYFSHDKLNNIKDQPRWFSDVVPGAVPFTASVNSSNLDSATVPAVTYSDGTLVPEVTADSVWAYNPANVTMLRIEFSWYGAVGAMFLAHVPDATTPGEARWVKVHAIRASNQHKLPSLGNPFLPISFYVARAGALVLSRLYKFGASFYIDGGDRGSLKTGSIANTADKGSIGTGGGGFGDVMIVLRMKDLINSIRNRMQVYPIRLGVGCSARCVVTLVKNPTPSSALPAFSTADALSPIETLLVPTQTVSAGNVVATFQVGAGGVDLDLSPYFAPNKDYLSFPLVAPAGDTLAVCLRAASGTVSAACSITWEEQQ